MANAKVSKSDIQAIIRAEIAAADGQANSQLSIERGENMDYYQGQPFGNEIEGRSSVISPTVLEAVEWMLPLLIRIFTSGENVVSFQPSEPNDTQFAKIATDYVSFIWNDDNRGFLTFYSWFKDALLQKNGIIKIWWDDTPKTVRKRFNGLPDPMFSKLVNDPDTEVSEHTENDTPMGKTHDVVLSKSMPNGKVCVVPVPPEEFLISKDARSIEGARFVGHRRRRTVSELIEEGYDREIIESLTGDETSIQTDAEEIKRNTVEYVVPTGEATVNTSMRQIWVVEGYIKIDVDGDGIAEMRKIVSAGATYEILANEAWDTPRPFATLTPIIMPHRFWGLAVADLVKDLQLIKSTILRQYLDNLYLSNNQREQVVEANIVDPSEVLSSKPGMKIRVKNEPAIFPIEVPQIGAQALEGLNYIDQLTENRTGVSARVQGMGSDPLHDTAQGERIMMSAALGKIELIARVFAETGVRDAFKMILRLVCEYQDKPRMIMLEGQQAFQNIDTSQWNPDMDVRVSVGLGMGDRDQQLAHAQMLGNAQAQAAQLGFVTPENFKATAELLIQGMGYKGVERFFTFPQDPNAAKQPVKIPPKNAGQQVNPQLEMQKAQIQAQTATQVATIKANADAQVKQAQAQAKAASDSNLHQLQTQQDTVHNQQQMQLEAFKAKVDGALELAVAHIRAAAQIEAARITAKYSDGGDAENREAAGEAA